MRERERERETDRQTNRQTDRQTDKQIDIQTDRQKDSIQLSTKFILLINIKIVGILTFISMLNTASERLDAIHSLFVCFLVFISS